MNQSVNEETAATSADTEISIWVDTYDDVFSDFDSRPYDNRELSDDFLTEVRKMVRSNAPGKVELKFHLMEDQRDEYTEMIIVSNLRTHFQDFAKIIEDEMTRVSRKGFILTTVGFVFGLFLVYLGTLGGHSVLLNSVHVVLEPLTWFMIWTGLDHIFQNSRKDKPTLDFNLKMANAEISFSSFAVATNTEADGGTITKKKKAIPCGNNLRIAS